MISVITLIIVLIIKIVIALIIPVLIILDKNEKFPNWFIIIDIFLIILLSIGNFITEDNVIRNSTIFGISKEIRTNDISNKYNIVKEKEEVVFSKKTIEKTYRIQQKLFIATQNENISYSGLNKEEKNIVDNYINNAKPENYVVNLTDLGIFTFGEKTEESDDPYVYTEDGELKIKYEDIDWEDDYYYVVYNGLKARLNKRNVPILYEETASKDYTYVYRNFGVRENVIEYYYEGLNDNRCLVIRFKLDNKENIKDINMIFDDYYWYNEEDYYKEERSNNNYERIIMVLSIFALFVVALYKLLQKARRNRY